MGLCHHDSNRLCIARAEFDIADVTSVGSLIWMNIEAFVRQGPEGLAPKETKNYCGQFFSFNQRTTLLTFE